MLKWIVWVNIKKMRTCHDYLLTSFFFIKKTSAQNNWRSKSWFLCPQMSTHTHSLILCHEHNLLVMLYKHFISSHMRMREAEWWSQEGDIISFFHSNRFLNFVFIFFRTFYSSQLLSHRHFKPLSFPSNDITCCCCCC